MGQNQRWKNGVRVVETLTLLLLLAFGAVDAHADSSPTPTSYYDLSTFRLFPDSEYNGLGTIWVSQPNGNPLLYLDNNPAGAAVTTFAKNLITVHFGSSHPSFTQLAIYGGTIYNPTYNANVTFTTDVQVNAPMSLQYKMDDVTNVPEGSDCVQSGCYGVSGCQGAYIVGSK